MAPEQIWNLPPPGPRPRVIKNYKALELARGFYRTEEREFHELSRMMWDLRRHLSPEEADACGLEGRKKPPGRLK